VVDHLGAKTSVDIGYLCAQLFGVLGGHGVAEQLAAHKSDLFCLVEEVNVELLAI
jgi:hypothetical protein